MGAELTLPSGDSVEGMCSMVTAETATGLLRRITTVPVEPRKAQHWPGEVPGLKTMPGSVPKKQTSFLNDHWVRWSGFTSASPPPGDIDSF